jgi:SAM-dependent methyltransferase
VSAALSCPLCASEGATELFRAPNGYPIVRCERCRLAFTDDRAAPPAGQLYPAFDQSSSLGLRGVRSALSVFQRQREAVVRAVRPSGRLLDFGCGAGAFARWMSAHGYDVVGLEPFSLGDEVREEKLRLVAQPLEAAAPSLGQFDVITLWHVLEHLHQPVATLRALSALLAPGGAFVLSVPNFASWQRKLFGGGWFHLDPPRHLLHFEPDTLRECLGRAGLAVDREWSFVPEYGSSGWLQSALNKVLPHQNFLYELVKDRGALTGLSLAQTAGHLVGSAALGAPALAASLPLELAAAAAGAGAAITLSARPR